MKKNTAIVLGILLIVSFAVMCSISCKNAGPGTPYDLSFTPTLTVTSTPTPVINVPGSVNVFVMDKGLAVPGLTIQAIPPSAATTYSQATTTTGIATFSPANLQLGTWTFIVPAQTPFPFAPSTITMPVSVSNETANFTSAGATIYLTPTVPESFTSNNPGTPFTYNLVYGQPGNLFVPAQLAFSGLPNNWSISSGPTSLGFGPADTGAVTVVGLNCVDVAPSFAVTAMDFESPSVPRAYSSTQTITKGFTSTVTCTWTVNNFNNNFCNDGNFIFIIGGNLTISSSNACSPNVNVYWKSGNCCSNQLSTPNGNIGAQDCGGGSLNFGPGNYGCTFYNDEYDPTIYCTFNGVTYHADIPFSGSVQIFSASY